MTKWYVWAASAALAGASLATAAEAPRFVVTGHPLAAILSELCAGRADVIDLLPAGASPHTYEPVPSDIRRASEAAALFFVSPALDGWAARLPAPRRVEVLALVPREARLPNLEVHDESGPHADAGASDPHFWTDPALVRAVVPRLAAELKTLDPGGAEVYDRNAARFEEQLRALDERIARQLAPVRGKPVVLFHPSFQYFIRRYGLRLAGVVTPSPGKEPTPRSLQKMVRLVREAGVKAIFSEPQLPRGPAEALAEAAGVRLFLLDPVGGRPGRQTYTELLEYNAGVLLEALR